MDVARTEAGAWIVVDMGAGGYRTFEAGTTPLACPGIAVGDRAEVDGREHYRVGVPHGGYWQELLNSDATVYWGSGQGNAGGVTADAESWNGRPYAVTLTLPPLSVLFFKGT